MDKRDLERALLESSLGQSLGEDICKDLIRSGELRSWKKNAVIFMESDDAIGMYLVISGIVKLTQYSQDGREVILHLAEPYSFIAEAAVFLGYYPATAVTVEDSELLLLRKERMFELMDHQPVFLRIVFDSMAFWLKRLVNKINQLTLSDATARVAEYLLGLEEKRQTDNERQVAKVRLPVKKSELATMLNINRSSLSRVFQRLQEDKVIDVQGRVISVLDRKTLHSLSLPFID